MSNRELKELLKNYSPEEIEEAMKQIESETNINQFKEKLFDWQREIVDYDRNHLVCCLDRGIGGTFTIASSILINRPEVVAYKSHANSVDIIRDKIMEIFHMSNIEDDIKLIKYNLYEHNIKIEWKDGFTTTIFKFPSRGMSKKVDYLFFDGYLPYAVDVKAKHVFTIINNEHVNYDGLKAILPTCTIEQFKSEVNSCER